MNDTGMANPPASPPTAQHKVIAVCRYANAAILMALALYFFLIPGGIVVSALRDPHLRAPGIPQCAVRWHRSLSPHYECWAQQRVASGAAAHLDVSNISGTEWPIFGSVFY